MGRVQAVKRKSVRVGIAILIVVGLVVGLRWRAEQQRQDAVRTLVEEYVELVATAESDDLQKLWSAELHESPGAMRMAGRFLVEAEERIEVVEVGEVTATEERGNYEVPMEAFVKVPVTYRLSGETVKTSVMLGRLRDRSGRSREDWWIVSGLQGLIGWKQPGFADLTVETYLGEHRVVRMLGFGGDTEDTQPLYPGVYRTQDRVNPWFVSQTKQVQVSTGTVEPPTQTLHATPRTRRRISRLFDASIRACERPSSYCRIDDRLAAAGIEVWEGRYKYDWLREPRLTFDQANVKVSGGRLRATAGGLPTRTIKIDGSLVIGLDNQSWTPVIFTYDVDGAPR